MSGVSGHDISDIRWITNNDGKNLTLSFGEEAAAAKAALDQLLAEMNSGGQPTRTVKIADRLLVRPSNVASAEVYKSAGFGG